MNSYVQHLATYSSKSEIWLGKILANDVCFAQFAKFFPTEFCAIWYVVMYVTHVSQKSFFGHFIKPRN